MANCRKGTIRQTKYNLSLIYTWTKILHPKIKSKVTELFFPNVLPPWVFRVQQWFMTSINRTERERSPTWVFGKIIRFGSRINKNHYFDPMLTSEKYSFLWFWSQIDEFCEKLNLVICSRSVQLIEVINHWCTLKNQEGNN